MNRFINNTIKKVSMVKGKEKKYFLGKLVDMTEILLNAVVSSNNWNTL